MLKGFTPEKIYLATGYTDLRKGIDGLAGIVQEQFQLDAFSDALFLFCGRRNDRIKGLYWDSNGFIMLYKRLESGSFVSVKRNRKGTRRGASSEKRTRVKLNQPCIAAGHSAAEAWLPNQNRREPALALRSAARSSSGTDQGRSPWPSQSG